MMIHIAQFLISVAANSTAMLVFWGLLALMGYEWSFKLYWSAFAVYVILSLGDAIRRGVRKSFQHDQAVA